MFLISACSESDVEDTNIEVIKKVLELQFTGPDEEFMELLWNPITNLQLISAIHRIRIGVIFYNIIRNN
ncbi:hypothetical protein [Psychrobacillus sp. OK028]|uniref:hypothetical protein n=1 Tax=Psychrobacillus sp. OK028 TaxID=1884359 RepID=UPI000B89680E|nr:hypothetical protein [Psychrobacillus sp. OK028]